MSTYQVAQLFAWNEASALPQRREMLFRFGWFVEYQIEFHRDVGVHCDGED